MCAALNTHHSQLSNAFDLLSEGLIPYVEQKVKHVYRERWEHQIRMGFKQHRMLSGQEKLVWDSHILLTVMWDHWNACFRHNLTNTDRSLISELREARNHWAHQKDFDFDDTYRTIDSIYRLLKSISASDQLVLQLQELKKSLILLRSSDEIPTYLVPPEVIPNISQDPSPQNSPLRIKQENHLRNIILYAICMLAVNAQVYISWGSHGWIMMSIISLVFLVLLADQFQEWKKKRQATLQNNVNNNSEAPHSNQTIHHQHQTSAKTISTPPSSPVHNALSPPELKLTSRV